MRVERLQSLLNAPVDICEMTARVEDEVRLQTAHAQQLDARFGALLHLLELGA